MKPYNDGRKIYFLLTKLKTIKINGIISNTVAYNNAMPNN